MTCQNGQKKHPTLLHIEIQNKDSTQASGTTVKQEETLVSNALVSMDSRDDTGAGRECVLAIVPVRVKLAKSDKTVTTNAFLDTGSSASFCTKRLMKHLHPKSRRTDNLLRTMGQEKPVSCYEVTGLEVANVEGDQLISLPKVYTQRKIPVTKGNILTPKDIRRWSYLKEISLTEVDAEVELLIGVNIPKAMEPWQVINSQDDGPYAVKTLLGWVVNGPLGGFTAADDAGRQKVMANRISIASLEEFLMQQYNHDFSEKHYEERSEMSEEEVRAQVRGYPVCVLSFICHSRHPNHQLEAF